MPDESSLNRQAHDLWEQNAAFWDEHMGEGNDFHLMLVAPTTERLLALQPGERVLEVACGNGAFARRMADLGARVTATDFSETFIERARGHSSAYAGRIDYRVVDATDPAQLLPLGVGSFDAAAANMALMDMAEIDPLLGALAELLRPGGRFVFSVTHPAFNSIYSYKALEEDEREGRLVFTHLIKTRGYLTPAAQRGEGVIGQPAPHYYFHRPISALLNACLRAGFMVDGFEEPAFPAGAPAKRPLSWENYPDFPPILVVRVTR